MNNPAIENAIQACKNVIINELKKELERLPNHGIQFDKPYYSAKFDENIVHLRCNEGRVLIGTTSPFGDTDEVPEEEDLELYAIDEMLTIYNRAFPLI